MSTRFLRYSALCFLATAAIKLYPHPVETRFDCHPAAQLMRKNLDNGQAFSATAITANAEVLQFYINQKTREWTVIGIDGTLKNRACTLTRGTDWLLPGEYHL